MRNTIGGRARENLFEVCLSTADTSTFALCLTALPLLAASLSILLPSLIG